MKRESQRPRDDPTIWLFVYQDDDDDETFIKPLQMVGELEEMRVVSLAKHCPPKGIRISLFPGPASHPSVAHVTPRLQYFLETGARVCNRVPYPGCPSVAVCTRVRKSGCRRTSSAKTCVERVAGR